MGALYQKKIPNEYNIGLIATISHSLPWIRVNIINLFYCNSLYRGKLSLYCAKKYGKQKHPHVNEKWLYYLDLNVHFVLTSPCISTDTKVYHGKLYGKVWTVYRWHYVHTLKIMFLHLRMFVLNLLTTIICYVCLLCLFTPAPLLQPSIWQF